MTNLRTPSGQLPDVTGGRRGKPTPASASDVAAILALMDGHYGRILQHLHDLHWNDVLISGTFAFDANGQISLDFQVDYACVAIQSSSAQPVTVTAASPQSAAPATGRGVHKVPANKAATLNIREKALTLYGNAGDLVSLQIFTKPQPPAFGGT